MQLALLCCYEAIIDGISKATANIEELKIEGLYTEANLDTLKQRLLDVRSAEAAVFTATHTLSDRMDQARQSLIALASALTGLNSPPPPPQPNPESSFRYSASISSSSSLSSLSWKFPSGGVWVTANSGFRVPPGCPSGSSSSSSSSSFISVIGKFPSKFSRKDTAPLKLKPLERAPRPPKNPGKLATKSLGKAAKSAPAKPAKKSPPKSAKKAAVKSTKRTKRK